MKNLSFETLNLTEISFAESTVIVGGSEGPGVKTMIVGAVVGSLFGPVGGMAFWAGYYINS